MKEIKEIYRAKSKEICNGCRVPSCLYTVYKREEECPCIECLVKVVCDAWCDKRIESKKGIRNE